MRLEKNSKWSQGQGKKLRSEVTSLLRPPSLSHLRTDTFGVISEKLVVECETLTCRKISMIAPRSVCIAKYDILRNDDCPAPTRSECFARINDLKHVWDI